MAHGRDSSGVCATAEPNASLQALLNVLDTADGNGYRSLDVARLRTAILNALPRVESEARTSIAKRLRERSQPQPQAASHPDDAAALGFSERS